MCSRSLVRMSCVFVLFAPHDGVDSVALAEFSALPNENVLGPADRFTACGAFRQHRLADLRLVFR